MSGLARLWRFLQDVFAPGLHVAFAGAWTLSLVGSLALLRDRPLRLDLPLLAAGVTVLLVLFTLRAIDELKDFDYDRVHNPDRLLVTGVVSRRDLKLWGGVSAALAVGLAGLLSAWSGAWALVALVALDLVHAVFLVRLERGAPAIRDGMLLNLLVTYPVNVLLSVFLYAIFLAAYGGGAEGAVAPEPARDLALLGAFALVFLSYELARKTAWPAASRPGERLYSNVLGGGGAIAAVALCALGATGLVLALFQPWTFGLGPRGLSGWAILGVPLLTALIVARFVRSRGGARRKLGGLGMMVLTVFYVALGLQALAGNALVLPAL